MYERFNIVLEHVKVSTNGEITGKVVAGDGLAETQDFQRLYQEMNSHFNNDQMISIINYSPRQNEICVCKFDKLWHRVRVEHVLTRTNGHHASCVFVDDGRDELVPVSWLRRLPDRFLHVPFQVKRVRLHGIQPVTMAMCEDATTVQKLVKRWDESAVKFIHNRIEGATAVRCVLVERLSDTDLSVRLYLENRSSSHTCLNEVLVKQNYAVNTSDVAEDMILPSSRPKKTIQDVIRSGQLRQMKDARFSNTEVAKSDTELTFQSSQDRVGVGVMEKGYNTDTQGASVLSHRAFHRSPGTGSASKLLDPLADKSVMDYRSGGQGSHTRGLGDPRLNDGDNKCSVGCGERRDSESGVKSHTTGSKEMSPYGGGFMGSGRGSNYSSSDEENVQKRMGQLSNRKSTQEQYMCFSDSSSLNSVSISSRSKYFHPAQTYTEQLTSNKFYYPKQSTSNHHFAKQTSDREIVKEHMDRAHCLSDSEPSGVRNSLPFPKHSDGDHLYSTERLPYFGRGALLKSDVSLQLSTMQGKNENDSATAISPRPAGRNEVMSESELGTRHIFDTQGGVSLRGRGSLLSGLETPGVCRPKQFSSPKSIRYMGNVDANPPRREVYSESELVPSNQNSAVDKASTTLKELVRIGAFDDTNIDPLSQYCNRNNSELLKLPHQGTKGSSGRGKILDRGDYSSGGESSSSAVSASVLGHGEFKKSRLPKFALGFKESGDAESKQKREMEESSLRTNLKKLISDIPEIDTTERYGASEAANLENRKIEMMGKLTGQKILEKLGSSSRSAGRQNSVTKVKETKKGMFGAEDGVVVHGIRPPKPYRDFVDTGKQFSQQVKQHWENSGFAAPSLVQAYAWPSIIRGRHVVTVSPSGTGKTLAYLYPIISAMSDARIYQGLPAGNGPLMIIVTKSWRRAEEVYDITCQLVASCNAARVMLVHGGGEEEKKACALINGCEILVVTAPSLKRLLEAGYTEVRRLCHLVIDDGDQVLKTFHKEVSYLVQEYDRCKIKQRKLPRQILVIGSQWHVGVEQFLDAFLCEPVLILTSAFEGSIYGRIKQVVHMSRADDRMKEVLGILKNVQDGKNKTIVFATKKEDIINMFKVARNCSYYCLMVHGESELHQVEHVTYEWNNKATLLICCDEYMSDMHITDASTVIHYDMPASKTQFANRLGCMRQFFYNFDDKNKQREPEPTSHLIISETCNYKKLWNINEMLQRTNSPIPSKLKHMLQENREERNNDKDRELCGQLLSFGTCRDKWRCESRHRVIPEVDVSRYSDWLPDEGEIKLVVSHVVDASHYYVRILSVRHDNNFNEDLPPRFSRLQMDIALWFSNLDNQKRETAPYVGEVCGYQENEMFYRVQILEFFEMNNKEGRGLGIEAYVKFVDTGRVDEVPAYKMYVYYKDYSAYF